MSTPLILISNDDGYRSEGIQILAKVLRKVGRVVIVAPEGEQSASSHSLTIHRPLRIVHQAEDVYSVDGTPTDCVMFAVHEILKKKPDLVVSGINCGANLGDDVHYSGTVSAAVEGALMGLPAIAVSTVVYSHEKSDKIHFDSAARITQVLAKKVLKEGLPVGCVLNVNVPNVSYNKIKGHEFTYLGKRNYGDVIFKKMDPRGRPYYWIGGDDRSFEDLPDSDCNVIQKNKISISPLQVDFTHYAFLKKLKTWKI